MITAQNRPQKKYFTGVDNKVSVKTREQQEDTNHQFQQNYYDSARLLSAIEKQNNNSYQPITRLRACFDQLGTKT